MKIDGQKPMIPTMMIRTFMTMMMMAEITKAAGPLELTVSQLENVADGKALFIMFYDSSCEECEDVSDPWNQVAAEWEGHEVGIIAQVDCSKEEGLPICQHFHLTNTPSFFYGGSMNWDQYYGEWTYEELSKFAKENISKPICSAYKEEYCNDDELKIIHELKEMKAEEFQALARTAIDEMQTLQDTFDEKHEELYQEQRKIHGIIGESVKEIMKKYNIKYVVQLLSEMEVPDEGYLDE